MCRPVTCKKCAKTTWAGCGMHVDDVRRSVPADLWCEGHDADPAPAAKPVLTPGKGLMGWLRKNS